MDKLNSSETCRGFSLIEVLVAIVLVCVAILGTIGMITKMMIFTATVDAQNRSATAAQNLYTMLSADRENIVKAGKIISGSPYFVTMSAPEISAITTSACPTYDGLDPGQRLECWIRDLKSSLDLNSLKICQTDGAISHGEVLCNSSGSAVVIEFSWTIRNKHECSSVLVSSGTDELVCSYALVGGI